MTPPPTRPHLTLRDLAPGETARVTGVQAGTTRRRRLLELGFTRGATVTVIRRAPLGDPVHIRVGSTNLAMRATDLTEITVQR